MNGEKWKIRLGKFFQPYLEGFEHHALGLNIS